jgi:hypothetical protein
MHVCFCCRRKGFPWANSCFISCLYFHARRKVKEILKVEIVVRFFWLDKLILVQPSL